MVKTELFLFLQQFDVDITDDFLETALVGSLAIEVWGNRSKGFGAQNKGSWNYNVEVPQKVPDRYVSAVPALFVLVKILSKCQWQTTKAKLKKYYIRIVW